MPRKLQHLAGGQAGPKPLLRLVRLAWREPQQREESSYLHSFGFSLGLHLLLLLVIAVGFETLSRLLSPAEPNPRIISAALVARSEVLPLELLEEPQEVQVEEVVEQPILFEVSFEPAHPEPEVLPKPVIVPKDWLDPDAAFADIANESWKLPPAEPLVLPPAAPPKIEPAPPQVGVVATPQARSTPLEYPAIARRMGWEGSGVLTIEADGAGRVLRVTLAKSSGYAVLDEAAIAGHWRFVYEPRGFLDPLLRRFSQRFRFELE